MIKLHIGVDDVDSIEGGCTTHFSVKLAWELLKRGYKFIDYPNLVRLNPSIPWKTRGNGAVALRLHVEDESKVQEILELAVAVLDEYTGVFRDLKRQSGLVLHIGDVPVEYRWIAEKALYDFVPVDLVQRALSKHSETRVYSINGARGLVGAVSAIGYTMENTDYTYELLAYRLPEYWGTRRLIDEASVIEMDKELGDKMILNVDYEYNRILITPHGPDPVLLGLRGEDPWILLEAFKKLKIYEPVEYIAIYRTNQHTDVHLHPVDSICEIRPYMCVRVKGVVSSKPRRITGGHVVFKLCDNKCCIDIAVYEPTKSFRNIVEMLEVGDVIEAMGCTRPPSSKHGLTLNLEKFKLLEATRVVRYVNPKCPRCGGSMESLGVNKGFRCRKCGFKDSSLRKIPIEVERGVKPGIYEPPPIAFKHLMKPVKRIGRERSFFKGIEVENFILKYT